MLEYVFGNTTALTVRDTLDGSFTKVAVSSSPVVFGRILFDDVEDDRNLISFVNESSIFVFSKKFGCRGGGVSNEISN